MNDFISMECIIIITALAKVNCFTIGISNNYLTFTIFVNSACANKPFNKTKMLNRRKSLFALFIYHLLLFPKTKIKLFLPPWPDKHDSEFPEKKRNKKDYLNATTMNDVSSWIFFFCFVLLFCFDKDFPTIVSLSIT
jgi:hypothetical protein